MDARYQQRLKDLEAEANLKFRVTQPLRHSLFSVPPAYGALASGLYASPLGNVAPLDFELRSLLMHSYRADIVAPADAAIVTGAYAMALYEAEPFNLTLDINSQNITLKYLEGSFVTGTVVSDVADAIFRKVHVLPNPIPLFYNRQYYLWADVQAGRARFFAPSRGRTLLATNQGGLSGATKPATKLTVDMVTSANQNAPCVELRSLYGAMVFGDPSEVY